jgi:hypothetical protein
MITDPAANTALRLVDLQKSVVALPTSPLARAKALAHRFRAAKAPVVRLGRVAKSHEIELQA